MPVQIAELKNLQTLSNFVVSKQQYGLKVSELRKFPYLQGKLSISKLQNVTDPSEAFQAKLKKKEQIDELELKWKCSASEDSQVERLVLEQLQPSTNLKKLNIHSYGGTSFPNWVGDSSFDNMVYLRISDCDHCWSLPPLGQLRSLKKLIISGLKLIRTVGTEFYGSCSSCSSVSFQPFPSLEILTFEEMPEWEEWNLIGGTFVEFPILKRLFLCDCPILKGNLPNNLPSLTELELTQCPMLNSQHHPDDVANNGNITRPLTRLSLHSLKELTVSSIPSLTSCPENALPATLFSLTFISCENLQFLSYESLPRYTSLEKLQIFNSCDSLTTFPLGCFPDLKSLFILGCENLKSITVTQCASPQSLSCLQSLSICACPNLESFPVSGSFTTPNLNNFLQSTLFLGFTS
ncbi:putative disease resistance RPP13 protein 1 [Spatholobus suberectus]|nr:putative disease resistance RPP13 protein 1 [Spatholobus suberectus]